jgi:hypothetical protein
MTVSPIIIQNIMSTVQSYIGNSLRATLFGGGLAYAIERNQWNQIPFVFLSPFAYASYHVTINHKDIINWCKSTAKELR